MLTEMTELQAQCRKEARDVFVAAAWANKPPSELVTLAIAAGLAGSEADELLERIRQGKEHASLVERLPRLRKDSVVARSRFAKVDSRTDAEISRLMREVHTSAFEAEKAQDAVNAADQSAQQLLLMHDEGLVPPSNMPAELHARIGRRSAEKATYKAEEARVRACDERDGIRLVVQRLENQFANMPILPEMDRIHQESALKGRIADARKELEEAQRRLDAAQAAEETARKAIR